MRLCPRCATHLTPDAEKCSVCGKLLPSKLEDLTSSPADEPEPQPVELEPMRLILPDVERRWSASAVVIGALVGFVAALVGFCGELGWKGVVPGIIGGCCCALIGGAMFGSMADGFQAAWACLMALLGFRRSPPQAAIDDTRMDEILHRFDSPADDPSIPEVEAPVDAIQKPKPDCSADLMP